MRWVDLAFLGPARHLAAVGAKCAASAAWILFILLVPPEARADNRHVLAFSINTEGHITVPIQINGSEISEAVIDTAATIALIDAQTARVSGIPAPDAFARRVTVLSLHEAIDHPVVRLNRLQAGPIALDALPAAFTDSGATPQTILPFSALPGDTLDFDFKSRTLTAYSGAPAKMQARRTDRMVYALVDGLMFVPVRINGVDGRALIDTGSRHTFVNPVFAARAGLAALEDERLSLSGASGEGQPVKLARAASVRLTKFDFRNTDMLIADAALFSELGLDDEPVMVLGLDVLSRFHVRFDRRHQRLILGVPKAQGKRPVPAP